MATFDTTPPYSHLHNVAAWGDGPGSEGEEREEEREHRGRKQRRELKGTFGRRAYERMLMNADAKRTSKMKEKRTWKDEMTLKILLIEYSQKNKGKLKMFRKEARGNDRRWRKWGLQFSDCFFRIREMRNYLKLMVLKMLTLQKRAK